VPVKDQLKRTFEGYKPGATEKEAQTEED
jgi:hypothetical protein